MISIKRHVFIIGSKGIPAAYGGFESFVDRLTCYRKDKGLQYHVSCAVNLESYREDEKEFTLYGARCFRIKWRKLGAARAVLYDVDALAEVCRYIREHHIEKPIIYILACRMGPFLGYYRKIIKKLGGTILVNPDGHEWKRAKWSAPVRGYWRISERMMVKNADVLICDSREIEKYIAREYGKYDPRTTFIAYGAETQHSKLDDTDPSFLAWCEEKGVRPGEYYLVVGRFVPENNYKVMIKEFMKSDSAKSFVLVTGVEGNSFYEALRQSTHFDTDSRIRFVGTVYDKELLKKIREKAYGYFHGHEVGGTNPSLLESMGSTDLNLLLDVGFNREVGRDCALYWTKEEGSLAGLIQKADSMGAGDIETLGARAKQRIREHYSWDYIVDSYEAFFLSQP